ncbi:MAG: hypothetical protein BroJett014_05620 [Planctomycetota bacterium]|nr:hypothetical protein [Planctomycetota bacterium]GIK51589.1 MAG: hypothetical protein BroJett014_05620 [Planctomycetota bacterium]
MSDALQTLLDPAQAQMSAGVQAAILAVCLPAVIFGLLGIRRLAGRLGSSGGAISTENFLLGVPLALAALMLADLVLVISIGSAYSQNRTQYALAYGALQLVTTLGCLVLLTRHPWEGRQAPPRPFMHVQARQLGGTSLIWALGVPLIVAAMLLGVAAARALGLPVERQHVLTNLTSHPTPASIAGAYMMAVVGVPLAEEFAFRLVLFGGLRGLLAGRESNRAGVALAYGLSIAIFVGAHGMWQMEQLYLALPLVTLSIMLTWVYDATKSIWPSTLFHMLHNGLVLTLQFSLADA